MTPEEARAIIRLTDPPPWKIIKTEDSEAETVE